MTDDQCTACGAHLDQHGHFEGCGNAGRYDNEDPTVPRPPTLEQFILNCANDCIEGN